MPVNRRRFLKYAGATVAAVGVSAIGLEYLVGPKLANVTESRRTSTSSTATIIPPQIVNFRWQPTRVVNDKVYDAILSFDVQGSEPISSLNATLDTYAPTIPAGAYPEEPPRNLQFNKSPSSETLSTQVTDLKGGKYYEATVQATDAAGHQASAQFETPYVREFENTAKGAGINIGAYYYPWYNSTSWWDDREKPKGTPLLGYYTNDFTYISQKQSEIVVSKHIDWSTGHKIGKWLSSWWGPSSRSGAALKRIFANPLISDIDIGIVYEGDGLLKSNQNRWDLNDGGYNRSQLTSHMDYFATNCFPSPHYWKINGRCVVYYYYSRSFIGDLEGAFGQLRDIAQNHGYKLFIIGDEMGDNRNWDSPSNWSSSRLKLYDGMTNYLALPGGFPVTTQDYKKVNVTNDNYANVLSSYLAEWSTATRNLGIKLIPFACPGYNTVNASEKTLLRDIARFKERLNTAKTYVDPDIKTLMITTFSEWFEGTRVEPGTDDGFATLDCIRET